MHKFQLNAASSSLMGRSWPLTEETLIGSSDDCQVQISAEGISTRHARVILLDGRLSLEDLQSESGTWLNGERIQQANLTSGDEIRIGQHRLLVQAPGLRPERVIQPEVPQQASRAWMGWLAALLAILVMAAWYYL